MGIASWALGDDNPFSKYVADNRQTLQGAFAGFGQGPTFAAGLGNAALGAQRGTMLDDITRSERAEEAKVAEQANATKAFLESKGWTDLIPLLDAGQGATVMQQVSARMQPGYGQTEAPKPIEVGGVLLDPVTYQPIFDSRGPEKPPAAPSGYQWNPDGTQTFIPGGPADPSTQAKTTEAQRRNQQLASVIQPELAAVEQNWSELASGANQAGGMIPGVGNALTSPGYQQASNSLATIAQSYLYSVSGAAATDAEVRKIVDSVTPKPFESQQSIDAKLARIRQMADAVIQAGGGSQQAPGGQTSSGLQWSIEP
jgi:hypothetical protein